MDYKYLAQTSLFEGLSTKDIPMLLSFLEGHIKKYKKDASVFRQGSKIEKIGLVLEGSIIIEIDDLWGRRTLLGKVGKGGFFGETYALLSQEPIMVNVVASEDSSILFLNTKNLLAKKSPAQGIYYRLVMNLLTITAQKNLELSRRSFHTSPKTIRERVLSYLSEQAKRNGKIDFNIPFDRQQLADYLSVDRSALSGELAKMKKEGFIDFRKNHFTIKEEKIEF